MRFSSMRLRILERVTVSSADNLIKLIRFNALVDVYLSENYQSGNYARSSNQVGVGN